ncbi:MAG: rod shape-determining protein MreC [Flavobacteriaceae bacterium]
MQQLIYFFQKYRYFLFFLLLQSIALVLTINNHSFHKSKFVNSANSVTGGFYNKVSSLSDYFQLASENKKLVQENTLLKNENELLKQASYSTIEVQVIDSTKYFQKYQYINGIVYKNSYASNYNFLTINLGAKDSIKKEMAVINSKGIIGITENVTNSYARVQSILNKDSKINARLKNSAYFGTLIWNGDDYNIVQLLDIPRQAILQKGDTIITGGRSAIFPEGIPIGTVIDIKEEGTSITKVVNIKLFNDMSNIRNIYVVKNFDKEEIESLENSSNE